MEKWIILFSVVFAVIINAGEYQVDRSAKNDVKFISVTTIQDFEGITDDIDGYLFFAGNDFLNKSKLYFEVDLNTLDTGIGLRNRHMRENYLETDKENYRMTTFTGMLTKAKKVSENEYDVVVEGDMFIHGVTKKMTAKGSIFRNDPSMEIKTTFSVKLSDFNIKIPSFMFLKLNNEIKLKLDFFVKSVE